MTDFETMMNVAADPQFRDRIGRIADTFAVPGMEGLDSELYRACFSTPAGRAVLEDLMQRYVMVSRFVPGEAEGSGYYREGMAQVVFDIAARCEAASQGDLEDGDEN